MLAVAGHANTSGTHPEYVSNKKLLHQLEWFGS
jgi:hypothetical protein